MILQISVLKLTMIRKPEEINLCKWYIHVYCYQCNYSENASIIILNCNCKLEKEKHISHTL